MSILFDNPPPAIGCGDPGDPIDYGLLTDSGKYLARSFVSKADTKKWTKVYWIKRWRLAELLAICGTANGGSYQAHQEYLSSSDSFAITINQSGVSGSDASMSTGGGAGIFYRDAGAWSQVHEIWDSNNPVSSERHIITIDGIRLPSSAHTVLPALGVESRWGQAIEHRINSYQVNGISGGAWIYGKHYLAEFIFISGFVVPAEAFGYFNAYKQWVNKTFAGKGQGATTYGASGFHHDFADPLDLGKDVSGNGNHFTSVGLTVDNQVSDTPTNNFAVSNPLDAPAPAGRILSEGNTSWQPAHNPGEGHIASTMLIPAEKYYWEVTVEAGAPFSPSTIVPGIGFAHSSVAVNEAGGDANGLFHYQSNGSIVANPWGSDTGYPTWTVGDVIRVAIDRSTGDCWFAKGLDWISGDPEAGTDPVFTIPVDWLDGLRASVQDSAGSGAVKAKVNFGQLGFDYPVPTGFRTLSSAGMPCPEILNPAKYITDRVVIGGADVNDLPFNPTVGKIAILSKRYDMNADWRLTTSVRGAGKFISTNTDSAEITGENGIEAFTPDGYLTSDTAAGVWLGSRYDLIFRASAKAGTDIIEFSHVNGIPTPVQTDVGGLISLLMLFPIGVGAGRLWHTDFGGNGFLRMDTPAGIQTDVDWIAPVSGQVTFDGGLASGDYIGLAFRDVVQFASASRYPGTGLADGPFDPADFAPLFSLIMGTSSSRAPRLFPALLNQGNPAINHLTLTDDAPVKNTMSVDLNSNGVKVRSSGADINQNGEAFKTFRVASQPGKFARAR